MLVLLMGCATVVRPVSPALVESVPVFEPADSEVLVPVTIKREVLVKFANASLAPSLKGTGKGVVKTVVGPLEYTYEYQFSRAPLAVNVSGTSFTLGTTLKGSVTARCSGVAATVNTSLAVMVAGNVALKPSWSLDPDLWGRLVVDSADIPIGFKVFDQWVGFSISIKDDLDKALQPPFAELVSSLKSQVAAFDVRSQVVPLWNALRSPISLTSAPPTWLVVDPEGVSFAPRDSSDGDLHVMVGLRAKTGVVFGSRPDDILVGPLPALDKPQTPSGFNLRAPVRIPFEELSRLAADSVVGQTYEVEGGKVSLAGLSVFATGGRLAVRADFTARHPVLGDSRGTLYFVGKLRFDEEAQRFVVSDFDFDAQTSHALVASASWLLHDYLVEQGKSALRKAFDEMGDAPLRSVRDEINRNLASLVFGGITAEGQLSDMRILGLGNDTRNLIVEAEFSGHLSLSVNQL